MIKSNQNTKEKPLRPLAPQPPCQSQVFWLNSYTLSVDGGKIGVFE